MSKTNFHIPLVDAMACESKLANSKQLQKLAKSFEYNDEEGLTANLKRLVGLIVEHFQLKGQEQQTLQEFMVQKNIPIEVNFKPLRGDQLRHLLQEWLGMYTESSIVVEKLYTNNHRNILFKRVLFDEKQTISDYFNTLSSKNMLKAVDLYQLLVDVLSAYHLYEFDADSQTFFEKVNSFNSFVDIVNKFVHFPKRISLGTTKEDIDYVRRIEFQRLIQFWEQQNHELTLLSEKRINLVEKGCQTAQLNVKHYGIQTDRESFDLMEFINSSLNALNKLTPTTNKSEDLIIIEQLYSSLRKAKINVLNTLNTIKNQSIRQSQHIGQHKIGSQSQEIYYGSSSPSQFRDANISISRVQPTNLLKLIEKADLQFQVSRSPSSSKKVKDVISNVYDLYQNSEGLSVTALEKCLTDIGVIDNRLHFLFQELFKRKLINARSHISLDEFKTIMNFLMQKDAELSLQVLQQFVQSKQRYKISIRPSNGNGTVGYRSRTSSAYTHYPKSYIGKYLNTTFKY